MRLSLLLLFLALNAQAAEPLKKCVIGGCSSQLCVEEGSDGISTCEARPEYACYRKATCERQPNGRCGWSPSEALSTCLKGAKHQSTDQIPK